MAIRSVVLVLQTICFIIVLSQIVNAQRAYQPQLVLQVNNNYVCSASILTNRTLLTAEQCVSGYVSGNNVSADLKVVDRDGNRYEIAKAYNNRSDLAVMVLQIVSFDTSVEPIPIGPVPPAGSFCEVSWDSSTSANVLSAPVIPLPNPICQTAFALLDKNVHLCGMTIGACVTQLGAPLVCGGTLVGINQSNGPCIPGLPRIYTRVSAYEPWIDSLIH